MLRSAGRPLLGEEVAADDEYADDEYAGGDPGAMPSQLEVEPEPETRPEREAEVAYRVGGQPADQLQHMNHVAEVVNAPPFWLYHMGSKDCGEIGLDHLAAITIRFGFSPSPSTRDEQPPCTEPEDCAQPRVEHI